jgi:SAM-dependent methyltransferase
VDDDQECARFSIMSVEVLKSKVEIGQARRELDRRELSFTSSRWKRFASKAGLSKTPDVGDELKSWDVLRTAHFIEHSVAKNAPILDIGAFASELPCILHKMHYSNLFGIDLNPAIKKMPFSDVVNYQISDFVRTQFANESFEAITAISVIEHGFNSGRLLGEISRLLRPGGYFIASFDYWPEKVDTRGVFFFGMDWTIFSAEDVRNFIDDASEYNLAPAGEINLGGGERPIKCAQKEYTFGWMVLRKGEINGGVLR